MNRSVHTNGVEKTPAISELYRDPYIAVLAEVPGALIRLLRSNVPHPTPIELEQSFRNVATAIDRHGRTGRLMLIDMREALGRNEPEFDVALRKIRPFVERDMVRVVVLLRSTVGMLQMKRINEEDGVPRALAMREHDALNFLRTGRFDNRPTTSIVATNDKKRY